MKIRLVYMRNRYDGFCIDEEWDINTLPRVGERVFLTRGHVYVIAKEEPSLAVGVLMPRRYDVVCVEHRWDTIHQIPHVQITSMGNLAFFKGDD